MPTDNPTPLPVAAAVDKRFLRNTRYPTLALIAGVTALTNLSRMVTGDASGGVITAQLPDAVLNDGMYFEFKKIDGSANALTVQATGGQSIDAAPTFSLTLIQQALGIVASGGNWKILYSPSTSAVVGTGGSTLLADGAFQTGGDFNPPALTVVPGTTKVITVSGSGNTHIAGSGTSGGSDSLPNITFGIRVDGVDYLTTAAEQQGAGADKVFDMVLNRSVLLPLAAGPHTISLVFASAGQRDALLGTGSYIACLSILYPVAIGGGPVVGGSGAVYATIALAIAGETETRVAGVVPQAGTVAGSIVGPGTLSAVNDFYKDWFAVNTDTTPSSGMTARQVRVSSYDGATRTLTIDGPWDYAAESDFLLVDPVRLTLKQDITEDVTVNKAAIMDLGGNRVKGTVDITASEFCLIRGGGYVTNGIQKTGIGYLRCENINISRRNATIYALLMTDGNNVGRCELYGCKINGVVAGRRGYMGWDIQNCTDFGLADGKNNTPFRLVESIAGIAVVMVSLDVNIIGQFSGSAMYSENSITGTAYVSIHGDISLTWLPTGSTLFTATRPSANIWKCVGAGVITMTLATVPLSIIDISFNDTFSEGSSQQPCAFSFVAINELTGSISLTLTGTVCHASGTTGNNNEFIAAIDVYGAATSSGNITITGGSFRFSSPVQNYMAVRFASTYTGTLSCSAGVVVRGFAPGFSVFTFAAPMNAGTPSVTFSGGFVIENTTTCVVANYVAALATAISVGTYVLSGAIGANLFSAGSFLLGQTVVSGTATFTVSNTVDLSSSGRSQSAWVIVDVVSPGGTYNITGSRVNVFGPTATTLYIVQNTANTGATITVSAPVTWHGFLVSGATRIISMGTAATATVSGAVVWRGCRIITASTLIPLVAGSTATGPTSLTMDACTFVGALTTSSSAGATLTWTGVSLDMLNCVVGGLFTLIGTNFTSIQAWLTAFNGNTSNKGITATGTRPATYRFWKCSFASRYDDLQPEVLNEYDILPAQAALVQGQPVKVNAANQYQVCVAASVVDGIALAAAGGAGTILIAIRQGRAYVTCKAGTANGDNLVLDIVTPTQANLAAAAVVGQEIGTALEAVGAVVAGKCYSAINVR